MALSDAIVWEVRSTATAANANGGGFKTGASGTDFSQQNAAQYSLTSVTTAAADAIMLHASAAADMVGNLAFVSAGTNFLVGRYEIISVVVGVSITVDRNCTSGIGIGGVVAIGGALSLASSDDAIFEALVAGNKMWVKNATYVLGGTVSMSNSGTAQKPIVIEGYATTRGDLPTGSTRPIFDCGAPTFTCGNDIEFKNIQFKGTGFSVLTLGNRNKLIDFKITNNSVSADRVGLTGGNNAFIFNSEIQCYRGIAMTTAAGAYTIDSCYIHDSKTGLAHTGAGQSCNIINSIFKNFTTFGINCTAAGTESISINRNTFHGCNVTGTAINLASGIQIPRVYNNTISNFAIGIAHAGTQTSQFDNYNNMFNNTTNVSGWVQGANNIALDPAFAVSDVLGTTATTSGSVITDSGKDFTALGVTAGRDFIYIVSGTGITVGIYGISTVGTTTLTLDIAPGTNATADKVYQIVKGANFAVGTNLKATGFPGVFPAGYTTGYQDIGAVQRQEATASTGIPTVRL